MFTWIANFTTIDHHRFCDLCPDFFKCRWFRTNERIVTVGHHTCFPQLMHKQSSLQIATFETHLLYDNSSQKFCKISAGCSHVIHLPCRLQIHPSRSCPYGIRANISQDESASMKAHTKSPVSTRRSNQAAYNISPRSCLQQ